MCTPADRQSTTVAIATNIGGDDDVPGHAVVPGAYDFAAANHRLSNEELTELNGRIEQFTAAVTS